MYCMFNHLTFRIYIILLLYFSCKGETGGGITAFSFFKGIPHIIQYGIMHGGKGNCTYQPGLSTDLSFYIDWILDNLES